MLLASLASFVGRFVPPPAPPKTLSSELVRRAEEKAATAPARPEPAAVEEIEALQRAMANRLREIEAQRSLERLYGRRGDHNGTGEAA
jgi:hypothetical protein